MKTFFTVTGITIVGIVIGVAGCIIAEKNGLNVSDIIPSKSSES